MPTPNARIFGPQHWNAIAKDIRTEYAQASEIDLETRDYRMHYRGRCRALEDLALRFAARFKIDNESFDPIKFLAQCSPDNEVFPLTELWEESH